jgi:D-alanyl-D-alanine dipeptidase
MLETTREGPPVEEGVFCTSDLIDLLSVDPRLLLDIRYATPNNFTGEAVYAQARAFLQRPAAMAVSRANDYLRERGYGLIIYDGYRPWSVTKKFWEVTTPDKKEFVANPANGSRHNRGCAVDLSMIDLKTGLPVHMPTDFDEFTSRSYADYDGGTEESRKNRELLRQAMEANQFTMYRYEWWHFDFEQWREYAIMDMSFDEIIGGMGTAL